MKRESLASKTTRSAAWLYGQRLASTLIQMVAIAILARTLSPADFGVVALAEVLMRFTIAFGKSTVQNFVIYDRKEGHEERTQAAFWLNMTLVTGAFLVILPVIPLVARFYQMPALGPVLFLMMLRLVFVQLTVVPDAIIRRCLNYQQLVVRDSALQLTAATLSVLMALTGWGVYSLVLPGILVVFPRSLIAFRISNWQPSLPLRTHYWSQVFSYTKHIMGRTILGAALDDGDTLIIGKTVGAAGLAIYDRGWRTANLVTKHIVWVVSDLAMPVLSSFTSQMEAYRQAYIRMVKILAIISFPASVAMFVLTEEIILTLYGPKWILTSITLRIFLVYVMQRSVGTSIGVVFNSVGRPDVAFKMNLVILPIFFAAILLGSLAGVNGIAVAVTGVKTIGGLIGIYLACRVIDLSYLALLKSLWPPLEVALLTGLAILGPKLLIQYIYPMNAVFTFLVCLTIGALFYFTLLLTRYTDQLDELLNILDSLSRPVGRRVRIFLNRKTPVITPKTSPTS